jgi:FMN phosphatase YigB (HAD superfamily)
MEGAAAEHPRPQAILTEILGVLVEDVWDRSARQLADRTGVNPRSLKAAFESRVPTFDRSGEDLEAFFREVALASELPCGLEEFNQVVLDSAVESIPANYGFLQSLHDSRSVRLIAVSNIPGPIFKAIDRKYPLSALFDDVVLSFREKIAKPNAQVYIQAIERAAVPPSTILYVDSSEEFVRGAREWGLRSIRLAKPAEFVPALAAHFGPSA